ncbi:hypothetical protein AL755_13635 [Arthrobacter sp. ERGS1:01]|uniref:hypothetical protein n=1 Tax=Arthrobacter sp. ERGS1:01 TaxID=1704044 RepID=UPI0006B500D7|nr:hypothetical protein [Arthrobacter sp. ERGS1:01]ALE06258.1 hypothetical protein AL755_13635 [Arthrobacter sp. ERGS1:01]
MGPTVPLELNLDVTTEHGATVTVNVTITYPEGQGLYAIAALEELAGTTKSLYREMAARKDASTLRALATLARTPNITEGQPLERC